ncbi:hypothetical protein [Schleiferilactobacillus shenzhenensis]|uniref:Uncharacterized protein n=1 Tax=Schleiferilactobacillus shenzhenensis LY-73 TaxID=1231336 RepID=U4TKQ3_9LACO|nr:hypothetical protein [Schleiferilactobacillus shenzhenensis]ERL65421.1 hypothetical protein L248_2820 [Schleiferilactobacillus shenzhenensis LY-73]
MTKNATQLTNDNNRLREQLNAPNKKYYEDLLLYIRGKSFLKDSQAVEQELLTILTDILAAQQDGVTAEAYFGQRPQETADAILAEVPNHWLGVVKMYGWLLLFVVLIMLLPALAIATVPVDAGTLLLTAAYWLSAATVVVAAIARSTYRPPHRWTTLWRILGIMVLLIPGFLIATLLKTPWRIYLSGGVGIAVILLLVAGGAIALWREPDRQMWLPFVPLMIVMALSGIVTRVPAWQKGLLDTTPGQITLGAVIVAGLLTFYGLTWRMVRKQ